MGDQPRSLSLDVRWEEVEDPVEFTVEAVCAADEEGDDGCRSDVTLAEASGPLPLHLEAAGIDLPDGARLVYRVTWHPPVPGMVGGTGQRFVGEGTLDVVGLASGSASESA